MTSLDAAAIRAGLPKEATLVLESFEVFPSIDSTNTYLMNQPSPAPGQVRVVLADHQTAGRGRHDRQWYSAPGESLCLSVSYCFQKIPPNISALTLSIGVGVVDALGSLGVVGLQLKWPNDLLVNDAKLGGILTETRHRGSNDVTVIVGIGINVQLRSGPTERSTWADSTTSLAAAMHDVPSRETLSQVVIESVMSTFREFESQGFAAFAERFADYDWLLAKAVSVDSADGVFSGIAAGIGDDGALLVDTKTGQRRIHAGSVTLAAPIEATQ